MIDENGDVRITDFGLAGLVEEFGEGAALEGTPEYMSPEQLEGRELTSRSDIYSLGLVIYELFTGRKAFSAKTLNELLRLRRTESLPESPSRYVKDLDPLVERVIERCLSADPKERPASALQVAAALPGGDPLAAALAAGETPSPEMVAAAPKEGSLRPAVAVAFLSGALILFALCFALSGRVYLHRYVPLEKTAQALQDRAWEISSRLGYSSATDRASGFAANNEYLSHVNLTDHSPARWELLKTGHPSGIVFWYRQSPRYLEPFNREDVTPQDPPRTISGMVGLTLDMRGRLLGFEAVPPQVMDRDAPPAPPDWSKLFNEAGLDISTFRQVAPEWVPPHAFGEQAAWEGIYPGQPDTKLRVEAASFGGRPVYFQLVNPWKQPIRQEEPPLPTSERILQAVIIVIFMVVLVGAALLARHNLRLGRGDRKGALRLAGFIFLLTNVTWIFGAHHVPSVNGEFSTFIESLSFSLLVACLLWLVYVALEPFVRRRWPGRIISWNRLLAGDWRDPLVGRDLLLGAFFGSALVLVGYMQVFVPRWLGMPPTQPAQVVLKGLLGFQNVPNLFVAQILNSLTFPAVFMFLVLLLTIVTRHERVAIVLFGLIYAALYLGGSSSLILDGALGLVISATTVFILLRLGMLTLVFTQFFILFFNFYPVTSDFSAWYAGSSAFAALLGAGLILYGFKSSLAGQQVFKGSLVED
jgi:serine/threonine-protein kinase